MDCYLINVACLDENECFNTDCKRASISCRSTPKETVRFLDLDFGIFCHFTGL